MTDENPLNPRGVGGWLLFLVLVLTILVPANVAWQTLEEWQAVRIAYPDYLASGEGQLFKTILWTASGLELSISVGTGLLLALRHRPSTVVIAIVNLWIIGFVISILSYSLGLFLFDERAALPDLGPLLRSIAFIAVWTAYLLKSSRVRNTFAFGQMAPMAASERDI